MNPLRLGSQPRGKPSGRWVEWRAGAKWEGQYEDGKRHGVWDAVVPITEDSCFGDSLYEGFESPLALRVTLHENVPHGEVSAVDASDRPVFTWHFDQGVLEGKATWWHPNGQTRRQVTYRAGLLDGPVAEWNADGKITLQQTYREGRASSSQIEWHEPGRKHFEGYSDLPGVVTRHAFFCIVLSWS
jgi:antitoxin component YwqK of YwqJK toxin-antitoxin module